MFKKDMILELSENSATTKEINKNNFINKIDFKKDVKIDIKNRNLYVIIEGEKIYIKIITLPKVKKSKIDNLIKRELLYNYKNIDDILFNYEILKETDKTIEVLVFCLKSSKTQTLIDMESNNINFKKVNLLQFYFKKYLERRIDSKNYIAIFEYNSNVYLVMCNNKKIVANDIIKCNKVNDYDLLFEVDTFIEKNKNYAEESEIIYYCNIKEICNLHKNSLLIPIKNIGDISESEVLNFVIKG